MLADRCGQEESVEMLAIYFKDLFFKTLLLYNGANADYSLTVYPGGIRRCSRGLLREMKLIVTSDHNESSRVVADMFKEVVLAKPSALLGLATGGSVVGVYECLVRDYEQGIVDFSDCKTVNLDEYIGVGNEHNRSFACFLKENFLGRVNFNNENIFLIDGSKNIDAELKRFKDFLCKHTIDILLLGIGTNGHIGFNEPAKKFSESPHLVDLAKETIQANARFFNTIEEVPQKAITMGMRDILKSKKIVLIATGQAKANALKKLMADDYIDPMLPGSILKLGHDVTIVVDKKLASSAGLG